MSDPIVAMGMPVAGPSVVAATAVDAVAAAPEPDMARLQRDGFPPGLAFEMHKSSQAFPLRIWARTRELGHARATQNADEMVSWAVGVVVEGH